jgi:dienelactone hydrolase
MLSRTFRNYLGLTLVGSLLLWTIGCQHARKVGPNRTLLKDALDLPSGDLAGPGPLPVGSEQIELRHRGTSLAVVLYRPAQTPPLSPAVVFLPGRMAPDDQYESYARALASRGFIVAVHGWYSPFFSDLELAEDSSVIADWLVGIAGHSMGGKDAMLAAIQYDQFASVVAIDPDDNGRLSVARGLISRLRAPLLLIGAEVAWQASRVCAPRETNYQRFFERAPAGTIELTLKDADHVQMLDEPNRFGYGICRCGTADSRQVRNTARRATVGFFAQHLQAGLPLPALLAGRAPLRVVQDVHNTEK